MRPVMNIHWDAGEYERNFSFVAEYGKGLADLLELPAGSRILDLGCGNGALTAHLHQKGYRTLGLDASAEQIARARLCYPHLSFDRADATDFHLPEPVDAVFSNAMFHWVDAGRQAAMMQCIAAALKPGGLLVAEMGGCGNTAAIHQALAAAFARRGIPYSTPFYFPTIGEYAPLVESAGMQLAYARLFPRPTRLSGSVADWIRMFVHAPFSGMGEELKQAIITEAQEALRPALFHGDGWDADYVRLRFVAMKTVVKNTP